MRFWISFASMVRELFVKNYGGDDEATDEMLVSVGHCEKREKFVHNACLLNYYYYLCDSFDEKLACATARCIAGRSAKASP